MSTTSRRLDVVFNNSMQNYLDEFYLSLQGDSNSLKSFLGRLSTLNDNIRTHRHKLQKETLFAARSLANTIDTVVSGLLDIQKASHNDDMVSDITKILDEKMNNLSIANADKLGHVDESSFPAYIKPSYQWLLANLHNPYPPKDIKKEISRQTKSSVRDIDAWFIDVRKRIGWNKLRKTHFSNKQEKIVGAATQIFKPTTSSFSEDMNSGCISETNTKDSHRPHFLTMANTAKSLYAGRFPELVSPSIPWYSIAQSAASPTNMTQTNQNFQVPTVLGNEADIVHYPTPEPSPPSYPVEESSPSNPFLMHAQPPSRKRRQSFSEDSERIVDDVIRRPTKRVRSDKHAVSRAATPPLLLQLSAADSPIHNPELLDLPPPEKKILKRKRRLSDGESHLPPKRPHNALCAPRLQAVSDPMPMNRAVEKDRLSEWVPTVIASGNTFSDVIPPPVTDENLTTLSSGGGADLPSYDIVCYDPELYISETLFDDDPKSNSSLGHDSFSSSDTLRNDAFGLTNSMNLQFNLIACPYQIDFHGDDIASDNEAVIFENPELISLPSGYISGSPKLGDMYTLCSLEPDFSVRVKTPVLGNFNDIPRSSPPNQDGQEAKRARAQALREELALYEAEGL